MPKAKGKSITGSPRATIKDVAKLANVDPSLVSRIVNNDPKASATEATRNRVLAAVAELDYRANSAARMLKTARTQMIGLLLPDLANPIYASIISGVEQRCLEVGYGLLLGSHAEGNSEKIFTGLLETGQVDGLLIASGMLPDSFLKRIVLDKHNPIVMVNRRVRGVSSSVIVNDSLGAELAVEHLARTGSKLMAGIFGPTFIDTAQRRRSGFIAACNKGRIKHIVIDQASWGMQDGYKAGIELFSRKVRPDTIFASTILMGIGLLRAAYELGVEIPEKIKVVAMHDSEIADFLSPTLTTVSMPTVEMGVQSVDLLLKLLEGAPPSHLSVDTAPTLVVRESSTKRNRYDAKIKGSQSVD